VRWFLVAIVAFALLVIQTAAFRVGGLAVPVDGHWTQPALLLILGLFLAFFFKPAEVFVAGWCLGLAADMINVTGRLGLQALEYSVILALVSSFQTALPRTRKLAQCLAALAVVFAVRLVWYLATPLLDGNAPALVQSIEESILDAAYTAILAPYVFWVLLLLRSPLGISSQVKPQRD
jgi:rod shape-determining protein MreD